MYSSATSDLIILVIVKRERSSNSVRNLEDPSVQFFIFF